MTFRVSAASNLDYWRQARQASLLPLQSTVEQYYRKRNKLRQVKKVAMINNLVFKYNWGFITYYSINDSIRVWEFYPSNSWEANFIVRVFDSTAAKASLLISMLIALTNLRGSFQHGVSRHNGRICGMNPVGPYHR